MKLGFARFTAVNFIGGNSIEDFLLYLSESVYLGETYKLVRNRAVIYYDIINASIAFNFVKL